MKPALWISMAANVVMAALLANWMAGDDPAITAAVESAANPELTQSIRKQLNHPAVTTALLDEPPIISPLAEETDLGRYANQLRELGMAESDVADVIHRRLTRIFEGRHRTIQPRDDGAQYWLAEGQRQPARTVETVLQTQALRRELRDELADILGEKWRYTNDVGTLTYFNYAFQFLPPEKRAALNDVSELRNFGFSETPEGYERWQREYKEKIASIMSVSELEQYNMRNSAEAQVTRDRLSKLNPSEEEFKVVYELANQYGSVALESITSEEVTSKLRERLGADRYREFVVAQDQQYERLKKIAHERGYSMEQTLSLAERKLAIRQESDRIMRDINMSPSDKEKKLLSMRDGLATTAINILGVNVDDDPAISRYLELWVLQRQIDRFNNQ